jgi:Ca-activated chloride channel family protein
LNREDFNNDQVDAGDVGSGHAVTAIYEIVPVGSKARLTDPLRYGKEEAKPAPKEPGEIAFLKLRYKLPDSDKSELIEQPIRSDQLIAGKIPQEPRFAAAVAAFGERLRGDPYLKNFGYDAILKLAQGARGKDPFGYRAEFVDLVRAAKAIPALPAQVRSDPGQPQ